MTVVEEVIVEDKVSNKITKVTSDEQYAYVTTIQDGISQTKKYEKHYIIEPQSQIMPRAVEMINGWYPKEPWQYTGVAIGRDFFAALADFGAGALVSYVAAAFKISESAASFLLGYMGAKYVTVGETLADMLDTNKNGWIGLYTRAASRYPNGPTEVHLHRTY